MKQYIMKQHIKDCMPYWLLIRLLAVKNYFRGEAAIKMLPALVDNTRAAIDVGANQGVYTFFLSKLASKVYAFEPNPMFHKVLISPLINPMLRFLMWRCQIPIDARTSTFLN